MKKSLRPLMLAFLFAACFFFTEAFAQEKPRVEPMANELVEIKTRLANIEKQQQEIVAKDNVILEKLDQLRVWVHRK